MWYFVLFPIFAKKYFFKLEIHTLREDLRLSREKESKLLVEVEELRSMYSELETMMMTSLGPDEKTERSTIEN